MSNTWQPSCSLALLQLRAQVLQTIRYFFANKAVLEVETPLLLETTGTDPNLAFFTTEYCPLPVPQNLYLQTSPEFAMKRLLAAGSGSIYQICKAFRNGELGRYHHPEFTLLEWYRVGFTLPLLMDEITELIEQLFSEYKQPLAATQRYRYQELFKSYTGLDPLVFNYSGYCHYALQQKCIEAIEICGEDHALWLDFIFSHHIQAHLGLNHLCLIYDYPACQSSLAKRSTIDSRVVERVELFINGIELGNGFYELTDAIEQEARFDNELTIRQQKKLPTANKDLHLLAALNAGLPDCSGIAIGLDRLLLLLADSVTIEDVLSFPLHRQLTSCLRRL